MKNKEIAKVIYEIADYLSAKEIKFKPYAYRKAASSINSLEEDIEIIYKRGGVKLLQDIPGVGEGIAFKIEEYIKTGKIKEHGELKREFPAELGEIISIEGVGVKKAKILYEKLGIKNIKELEKAALNNKVAPLFGFGEKTEKNILVGISFLKLGKGRFLLGEIMPFVERLIFNLKEIKEVNKISVAGSVRRKKETVGDIDILIASNNPKKIMDFFISLPEVKKVWGKGITKSSIRVEEGFDIDLRIVPLKSYGSALQYFTGSKDHNIKTRRIAMSKGLKLNEYGVFKNSKMIAGKNEEEIYKAIGLPFITPEIREDRGEIEAALNKRLPEKINIEDIKGDLHCHSAWDGGKNTIKEMALHAKGMGYKYIGIADHTKFLKIENGLDEKRLLMQSKEIKELNIFFNPGFTILHGCEANIMKDGSIDIKDEILEKLDFVIAGVHSSFKMDRKKMTDRIIKAIENKNVDIISHPTGRIIKRREEYKIDIDKILGVAKKNKKILEINSCPERLDLKDVNIKKAKDMGIKMIINSDAHKKEQMFSVKYGVFQARRGWAEKGDIINTYSLKELLNVFKKNE